MSLDKNAVERIAQLARLSLDPGEIQDYQHDLGQILDLVDQLEAATTANIKPLAHPLDLAARLRPDEISEANQRDAFQAHAPSVADGYYLVPKVID